MHTQDLLIRDHVVAATRLLLHNRKLKDGVVVTGGDVLDFDRKIALGQNVGMTGADLLHLEFDHDDRGDYRLRSLVVMAARDGVVHVKADCQLWLGQSGKRALVLPPPGHLGAFRLAPTEVVQILQRPVDEAEGLVRARIRLQELVASGARADNLSVNFAF